MMSNSSRKNKGHLYQDISYTFALGIDRPMVIMLYGTKGGIGKTTFAIQLASHLAESGQNVVLCDLDPQCNTTASFPSDTQPKTSSSSSTEYFSFVEGDEDDEESVDEEIEQHKQNIDKREETNPVDEFDPVVNITKNLVDELSSVDHINIAKTAEKVDSWSSIKPDGEKYIKQFRHQVVAKRLHSMSKYKLHDQPFLPFFKSSYNCVSSAGTMNSYMSDLTGSMYDSPLLTAFRLFKNGEMDDLDTLLQSDASYFTDQKKNKYAGFMKLFAGSVHLRQFDSYFYDILKSPVQPRDAGCFSYIFNSMATFLKASIIVIDASADQSALNEVLFCNSDYILSPLNACMYSCTSLCISLSTLFPKWLMSHSRLKAKMIQWVKEQKVVDPEETFQLKKYLLSPNPPKMLPILVNMMNANKTTVSLPHSELIHTMKLYLDEYLQRIDSDSTNSMIRFELIDGQPLVNFMKNYPAFGQCADMGTSVATVTEDEFMNYFVTNHGKKETKKVKKLLTMFMTQVKDIKYRFSHLANWIGYLLRQREDAKRVRLQTLFLEFYQSVAEKSQVVEEQPVSGCMGSADTSNTSLKKKKERPTVRVKKTNETTSSIGKKRAQPIQKQSSTKKKSSTKESSSSIPEKVGEAICVTADNATTHTLISATAVVSAPSHAESNDDKGGKNKVGKKDRFERLTTMSMSMGGPGTCLSKESVDLSKEEDEEEDDEEDAFDPSPSLSASVYSRSQDM